MIHNSRRFEDLEKHQALNNKSGVVGMPGIIVPTKPNPTDIIPTIKNKYFKSKIDK